MSALILSAAQAAVVAGLTARYTDFAVELHGGNFAERELPFLLGKAPVILVSCAKVLDFQTLGPDGWKGTLQWTLAVLATDTATTPRAAMALDTIFDLLRWVPSQRWGLQEAELPDPESMVNADNLYTGHVNALRVALWGTGWKQTFQTLY